MRQTRRQFLSTTSAAAGGFWIASSYAETFGQGANDKLNIACIGCGGMGSGHVSRAAGQNLVALCDVDEKRAATAFDRYPKAKKYHDYRKMFDEMHKEIDAVYVATPDHHHAPASMLAMRLGKHVYCEKPMAHSVYEARQMAATAAKMKVATQMGNQGHGSPASRTLVEVIRSGVLGKLKEAHAWTPKNFSATSRPKAATPPESLKTWDIWVGPAPMRPYSPSYLPFNWRSWWDFGTGGLGDMACHIMDPIFWALDLDYPATVEATGNPRTNPEGFQTDLTVEYTFKARGKEYYQQSVTFFWHHGGNVPQKKPIAGVEIPPDVKLPDQGVMLIGEKGVIIGGHGPGLVAMLPKERFADYQKPAPSLPRGPGHHEEWHQACKGGKPALSNFEYAAKLTETVLLGNLAWKVGKKLEWDAQAGRATNCPEADAFIKREYRSGWTL